MERKVMVPFADGREGIEELQLVDNLVIVGSNGSGKSRFGGRMENSIHERPVKRIAAQRSLAFKSTADPKTHTESVNQLLSTNKGHDVTIPLSDFDVLLSSVFAETTRRDSEYVTLCKTATTIQPIPESVIEILTRIWNDVLPQKELLFHDNNILVVNTGGDYSVQSMSDGEKVTFYLLAQSLILPANCVIIIDEPELHLHKALMARLWNAIEKERHDCIFVYITHDLDFASSRVKAKKIWVKSFSGRGWIWELVPESTELPENLLLELIGSRRPILFVEGERGSYDHEIYQFAYPSLTIIPRGSSSKVIESVRGISENTSLHNIKTFGLIDRDYKTDEEVNAISRNGIYVLDFAEVENLLLIPDLVKAVARNQANNEEVELNKVKEYVFQELARDFDRIVSFRASLMVNYKLNAFDQKQVGERGIEDAMAALIASIDVKAIYEENRALYQGILDTGNYEEALKYYNNKGLVARVSTLLGLGSGQYPKLILRLIGEIDRREQIAAAIHQYLPPIS